MSRRSGRIIGFLASLTAGLFVWAGVASAHVTVWPKTSTTAAWEKYTVRVPTEKTVPTVKVVLKIPSGVTFEQYEPVPGWSVSEKTGTDGRVTSVTWTATGGGIAPGQFQEFSFVAQNPKSPTSLAWDAYQYYKDGSIVEWTGPEGADTPHSVTQILASAPATAPAAAPAAPAPAAANQTQVWMWVISVVALVLSVISLLVAGRGARRR
ncbi:MAG: YcnI family protein [Alicyclobacillus sp.]|nr:YcnI family protein [Alicyclobacillus sp.]